MSRGRDTGCPAETPGRRWLGRAALAAISVSVAMMVVMGVDNPPAQMAALPVAPPWPPWFVHLHISPVLVSVVTWLTVVLGGFGLAAGLLAVQRGWRPSVRRLILGSVVAVIALTLVRPVASDDPLYYAAYGRIAVLGHNPYAMSPEQLMPSHDPVRVVVSHYSDDPPSRYGPVATATEVAASELAGDSSARTIFWLKVWNALAFMALVLALDRLVRSDSARRVRVHLMWSVNPLMLLAVMADGHNDVLAAAMSVTALLAMRRVDSRTALLAGVLLGLATGVKITFAVFGVAMAWSARRSPRVLAALALGAAAALVPGYLIFGPAAISATTTGLASGAPPDLLWRDVAIVLGWQHEVGRASTVALIGSAVLAVLLLWRMPPGARDVPAGRVALALAVALLFAAPLQRVSYDAMIFPLLAVMPVSRLDWLVVARSTALGVASVPIFYPLHPPWPAVIERFSTDVGVLVVLVAVIVALLWLCLTREWRVAIDDRGAFSTVDTRSEIGAGTVP